MPETPPARPSRDPTGRFGDRAEDYARYRPDYPAALTAYLRERGWLPERAEVADVGAGTGISSALFLDAGCTVYAIEPNAPMRAAAERRLAGRAGFHAIDGRAEATGLADASVDLVAAGTAFHWFDAAAARAEFARILRGRGAVALFWNARRRDSAFMHEYAAILTAHCAGYAEADARRRDDDAAVRAFFGAGIADTTTFANAQRFDFDGLLGRVRSSSYAPKPGEPAYAELRAALRALFERAAAAGRVTLAYDTHLYVGSVR
ncbi:MAG TPA: class I SAM-dependent methyltransferase [Dokdonella sp.]